MDMIGWSEALLRMMRSSITSATVDGGRVMEELREPTEVEREQDIKFLTHILFEIRDYARSAGQEPDETLKATAEWILTLLKVATFNGEEGEG